MSPEERFRELKEQSDNFNNKQMIRFHFIRNIREAVAEATAAQGGDKRISFEALEQAVGITEYCPHIHCAAIRALKEVGPIE